MNNIDSISLILLTFDKIKIYFVSYTFRLKILLTRLIDLDKYR